jgi:hypothetical protein
MQPARAGQREIRAAMSEPLDIEAILKARRWEVEEDVSDNTSVRLGLGGDKDDMIDDLRTMVKASERWADSVTSELRTAQAHIARQEARHAAELAAERARCDALVLAVNEWPASHHTRAIDLARVAIARARAAK